MFWIFSNQVKKNGFHVISLGTQLLEVAKSRPSGLLLNGVILFITLQFSSPLHAECTGKGLFGATPKDPVLSVVDIIFSPVYSSATTSGTSGCQNWDFAKLLNEERLHFVRNQHELLLEQSSKGYGPQLEVWARLMSCVPEVQSQFNRMLRHHYPVSMEMLKKLDGYFVYSTWVSRWIEEDSILQMACPLADLTSEV